MEDFKGMTVNERLYLSGLMDEFDEAVKKRDLVKIKEILEKVKLDSSSILAIINSCDSIKQSCIHTRRLKKP